jgi:hypothetical protein
MGTARLLPRDVQEPPAGGGVGRHMAVESKLRTIEQLRHDIDSGRTGDKVAVGDPAAAPLGADDEAAGTPVSPDRLAREQVQREGFPRPARGAQQRVSLAVLGVGTGMAVLVLVALAMG